MDGGGADGFWSTRSESCEAEEYERAPRSCSGVLMAGRLDGYALERGYLEFF
jgi:hypothetical protein